MSVDNQLISEYWIKWLLLYFSTHLGRADICHWCQSVRIGHVPIFSISCYELRSYITPRIVCMKTLVPRVNISLQFF